MTKNEKEGRQIIDLSYTGSVVGCMTKFHTLKDKILNTNNEKANAIPWTNFFKDDSTLVQ